MSQISKKLFLNKETVVTLNAEQMKTVVGGINNPTTGYTRNDYSCLDTCEGDNCGDTNYATCSPATIFPCESVGKLCLEPY